MGREAGGNSVLILHTAPSELKSSPAVHIQYNLQDVTALPKNTHFLHLSAHNTTQDSGVCVFVGVCFKVQCWQVRVFVCVCVCKVQFALQSQQ